MSEDEGTASPSLVKEAHKTPEELLLQHARWGDVDHVSWLLQETPVDVNCKGKQKSNYGWTPLHLACYFGHKAVVEILLQCNADVNVTNEQGDTPLHKAAYTGREELVVLLLSNNADVWALNCEGNSPTDLAKDEHIRKLLKAAQETDMQKKNEKMFSAARQGNIEMIKELLSSSHAPNIDKQDLFGNTALHHAARRGQKEMAVFLLQNGADPTITNARGQTPADLTTNQQMKCVLLVQPFREIQKVANRFEGFLLRKGRFLGWRRWWVVLERGVLSYFVSRADAANGIKRKSYKYLDGASIKVDPVDQAMFQVHFSDNTTQRFSVNFCQLHQVDRQKWLNAFREHIDFSTYYIKQGMPVDYDSDEEDSEVLPIGSMQEVLQSAQANQKNLQEEVNMLLDLIEKIFPRLETCKNGLTFSEELVRILKMNLDRIVSSSHTMVSSLSHCMTIFVQQEEARLLQLKNEQERCRVLEDALHVLAKEHHELELSVVSQTPPCSPSPYDTDCDEFFDAFEGDDSTPVNSASDDDARTDSESTATLADCEDEDETSYYSDDPSMANSKSAPPYPRVMSKWGRTRLPAPMFSNNDFNVWSILKHCIGKELSKITMPVVFNEPLSFLQRVTENMEYSHLLTRADETIDPIERMEYVAAYAVSALASNWERLQKPFNPLLGETYELERKEQGFRIMCEQVSHHPPISAFYSDSPHFIFHGSVYPKLKFWGKSIEVKPEGTLTLELRSHKEVYTWKNVNCCVHNIIVGKLWFEQYGQMEITCHTTGLKAMLTFKPAGWFGRDLNRLEGFIIDRDKKKHRFLYGKWTDYLKSVDIPTYEEYMRTHSQKFRAPDHPNQGGQNSPSNATPSASPSHTPKKMVAKLNTFTRSLTGSAASTSVDMPMPSDEIPTVGNGEIPKSDSSNSLDIPNSTFLWQVDPRPEYSSEYFHFTLFAMSLNEMRDGMEKYLPRTDCRFRPDVRKLEEGDLDGAAAEKNRLEEKQREARKLRKKRKETWEPQWFALSSNPCTKEEDWIYKGGYWDRNYSDAPDIF